jgi:hypothetical protein
MMFHGRRRSQSSRIVAAAVVVLALGSCGSDGDGADDTVTSTSGSCADLAAFGERILDTGIIYDYEPSDSPADLAAQSDVVISGFLTGAFSDRQTGDGDAVALFEVEINELVTGPDIVEPGDTVNVAVDFNPAALSADDFEQTIPPNAPVVVFANSTDVESEYVAFIEGFMTACDGALLGLRGELGTWQDMTSLEDVLEAVRQ